MGIVLSAQTLMAQVPSYIPSNGLVGFWPFNGNANDLSLNSNNGTVNGATLTTDRNGNANSAYSFNGINNSISVSNSQQLLNLSNFTYSTWVYANINTPADGLVICSYDGNSRGALLYSNTNSSEIRIHSNSNTDISAVAQSNTLSMSWHHIVAVKNDNELKMYLDNILIDTINISNFNYSTSSIYPLMFGKASWYNGGYFNGKIDDIGIWNRALTQAEITTLFTEVPQYSDTCNNVSGSLTYGLVGYWPFCGNALDDSGHGNNGSANGATLTIDRFGNSNSAYSFDGINDFINMPSGASTSLNITSDLSLSFWFKTTQSNNSGLIGFGDNLNSLNGGFLAAIGNGNSGNPIGKLTAMTGNIWYTGTNILTDNNWHFACITISGNTMSFFIDNILDSQFNNVSIPASFNGLRAIGARNNGLAGYFNGLIDDIGVWNRALTPSEVTQLFNQNQCFTNTTVTDTLVINVGQLSYTNPVAYANNITIFPNPASSQININFNNITNLNGGTLKIINSLGQEVATTPITTSGTNSTMQLTTWGGTGMYFVQIINPQGQIVDIKKIILQ